MSATPKHIPFDGAGVYRLMDGRFIHVDEFRRSKEEIHVPRGTVGAVTSQAQVLSWERDGTVEFGFRVSLDFRRSIYLAEKLTPPPPIDGMKPSGEFRTPVKGIDSHWFYRDAEGVWKLQWWDVAYPVDGGRYWIAVPDEAEELAEADVEAGLHLQKGKRYLRRDGSVSGVMKPSQDGDYPWRDMSMQPVPPSPTCSDTGKSLWDSAESDWTYTENGRRQLQCEHGTDLVAEVPDAPEGHEHLDPPEYREPQSSEYFLRRSGEAEQMEECPIKLNCFDGDDRKRWILRKVLTEAAAKSEVIDAVYGEGAAQDLHELNELAAKADGWIDWSGGECPVDEGVIVDVCFRDGTTDDSLVAGMMNWDDDGLSCDIVAYRVVPADQSVTTDLPAEPEKQPQHTPGPWGVEQTRSMNWIGPLRVDGKVDTIVASICREGLKPEALVEVDANAVVIAQAAEITEWLNLLPAHLNTVSDSDSPLTKLVRLMSDWETRGRHLEKMRLMNQITEEMSDGEEVETCQWAYDEGYNAQGWKTQCGKLHCFIEGGIEENEYAHCPHCGKRITEALRETEAEKRLREVGVTVDGDGCGYQIGLTDRVYIDCAVWSLDRLEAIAAHMRQKGGEE